MGEVVNVLVAFAVIVVIFRWATSPGGDAPTASGGAPSPQAVLGFRPKNVTQGMVDQVLAMFPDMPPDNVRFDLLRTGSVQLTTNKILERGFLDPPPQAYYTLYPRQDQPAAPSSTTAASTTTARAAPKNLIARYHLEERLKRDAASDPAPTTADPGGKAPWEESAEKREASLRERKAQMILAARQRLLAAQKGKTAEGKTA
ncbi:uncharacterized protein SCHCODRAFT_02643865 [Schizophyllum commune H4-8]|uniref:CUE domain-containing protein n=1 Tax=Schizophyllum commune (strain H4-8 / FGSC 9210) TaxID=578458 RepID=D8QJX9_SCHCM|nr:uncharacterized protein SCHCODRAFT_02643865 [Schizophyllum commune H4-8]KAI5885612.1 hypothetical protein SCHCODRAFT_02643865 [Schizophyllum commune H4-8]